MAPKLSIGCPRMMKEQGEKRVFLPEFIQAMSCLGADIYLEEGYGSRSGLSFDDFRRGNEAVRLCDRQETFHQDFVLVLRSPLMEEYSLLGEESCLISMLHFPTRPRRVELLKNMGARAISLDTILNDNNLRLVENMKAVAWNGLEAAYDVLEKRWPNLRKPDGEPVYSLVLGTGMVGKHAVDAATKLGNIERNTQHMRVGRNLTRQNERMQKLFSQTDILVDATQRRDTSKPVVPNEWIDWLPKHTVITDLAVDPYLLEIQPPVVRGVEGIPQGNLDQYVFAPDEPGWDNTVPATIPSQNRRTAVTCYSWPGIHPEACMMHYAQQLEPLMGVLLRKGYDQLSLGGDYFERALYRGTLKYWLQSGHYEPRPR